MTGGGGPSGAALAQPRLSGRRPPRRADSSLGHGSLGQAKAEWCPVDTARAESAPPGGVDPVPQSGLVGDQVDGRTLARRAGDHVLGESADRGLGGDVQRLVQVLGGEGPPGRGRGGRARSGPDRRDPSADEAAWRASRFGDTRFTFWKTPDGTPVSMAGSTPMVAGMVRVDPVHTPAHLRRRGYAGAVTVAVSEAALDAGATDVVLFTNPANRTSNGPIPAHRIRTGRRLHRVRLLLRRAGNRSGITPAALLTSSAAAATLRGDLVSYMTIRAMARGTPGPRIRAPGSVDAPSRRPRERGL